MESNLKMTLCDKTHPSRGQRVFSGPRTDVHKWELLKHASDIQVAIVSVSFETLPPPTPPPTRSIGGLEKKPAIAGKH